jgi:hypothetical protein
MLIKKNKLLFILFFLITGVNVFIFFNREDHVFIKQSSLAELYPVTGNQLVRDFKELNDSSISIVLKDPPSKPVNWQVFKNYVLLVSVTAEEPFFTLQEGIHNYRIYSESLTDTIQLKAEYISAKSSIEKDRIGNAGITVFKADLPIGSLQKHLDTWKDDEIPVTDTEARAIQVILRDSMGISKNENTVDKIKKMGGYLGSKLIAAAGNPTSTINGLSVFQQYKSSFGRQKLWCGNIAQIFNLFAKAANIKSRVIHISRNFGSLKGNEHIFNEYFIPEMKKWAALDLLFNNIIYTDASGKILNAVEVKNTNPDDSSVTVLHADVNGSLIFKPFSSLGTVFFDTYGTDKDLRFYHRTYKAGVYSLKEKIIRYFSKRSWFELYSDTAITDNYRFYIKQLFLLLETGILFLIISVFALSRFKKNN